jgi:SAM-dependent methyltransferase
VYNERNSILMKKFNSKDVPKRNAKSWNREYAKPEHLKLSNNPAEDFLKALRYIERHYGREYLNPLALAVDIGCGNGRHLVHLANYFAMRGVGYDISKEAIDQAIELSKDLPITYEVRTIAGTFPEVKDNSVSIVIDMMSSHVLKSAERDVLRSEILRMLKPGGWLIFKSFLADEDINTRRLLRDHPADEEGAYIHPGFGVYEYVWTEDAILDFYVPGFSIEKIEKSHKHIIRNRAGKRRTVTVYMRKNAAA